MKKVLLGVSGGIAAYKSPDLVRRLREVGFEVRVVLSKGGKAFITHLSLQAVSGQPVHEDLLDSSAEAAMGHIELARWADLILIAPASANFIAKLAHGLADDLLSTLCVATKASIVLAPAMNQAMWQNAATQENLSIVARRGVKILGPASGSQACGEVGPGRMLQPLDIVQGVQSLEVKPYLSGKKILISAGPTQEPLDPVRYLSNKSSGKMGYALAEAARDAGAEVTLISGPVSLAAPGGMQVIKVQTAEQMLQAVLEAVSGQDVFISTAAVADYRSEQVARHKLKKSGSDLQLKLIANVDILAEVSALSHKPMLVGFAAETEKLVEHAEQKRIKKNLDMVVANDVSQAGIGFDADDNAVTVLSAEGKVEFNKMAKRELAKQLLQLIAKQLG